ncbi:MAG: NAD(P)-dependent alcohol dehydrogenase [Thermoplasmata archaeon]|nr:NAD(P)-dependent alcohol dehydrogenase [Thermoplasmata archaeon]
MRGWAFERYGSPDVLQLRDLPMPRFRDENEVLIRVRSTSVNPADRHSLRPPLLFRRGQGWLRPKDGRLGRDLAGQIEAIGTGVRDLHVGDEVFGVGRGAFGDYAIADQSEIAAKPASVSFEDAGAVPIAATTALQGLRDHAKVRAGQRVLVNGAAGGVGTFAVQIARSLGAEVHGVCSTRNVDLVRSLGATRVFDYAAEDFTRSGERYDVVFDTQLNHSLAAYRRVLRSGGLLLIVGAGSGKIGSLLLRLLGKWVGARLVGPRTRFFVARVKRADLVILSDLLTKQTVRPVIDRRYPLAQVPDALRYLIEGHARGKIVVAA